MSVAPLQFLLLVFAGWVNRRQVEILEDLREENRILREQLGGRRLRFTDAQRRRLATKGQAFGRRVLQQLAGLVTPDTILRWYRELIANKYDGTARRGGGRSSRPATRIRASGCTDSDRSTRAGIRPAASGIRFRADLRSIDIWHQTASFPFLRAAVSPSSPNPSSAAAPPASPDAPQRRARLRRPRRCFAGRLQLASAYASRSRLTALGIGSVR